MALRSLPAVYMRGGTSKAIFFDRRDLPALETGDMSAWNEIFCAALGSPDPYRRQLNGMGRGITSLSKVAIVGPPTHADADVDYTFAQVDVTAPVVGYRGNCGNISSAVGPYAVDRGLVKVAGETADVVIHNTNTGKLIRARFALEDGQPAVEGAMLLDGVAGHGSPIELAFLDPAGAATGQLFPTGNRTDVLELTGLAVEGASMVDVCNPVIFLRADALGLAGKETPDQMAANPALLALFEDVRVAAAKAMGMVASENEARTTLRNLPLVCLVSETRLEEAAHVEVRMISSGQPHKATPLTGAMCVAAAAAIPGTLVNAVSRRIENGAPIRIAHASGLIEVSARGQFVHDNPSIAEAIVYRTARKLMEGRVFF